MEFQQWIAAGTVLVAVGINWGVVKMSISFLKKDVMELKEQNKADQDDVSKLSETLHDMSIQVAKTATHVEWLVKEYKNGTKN